MNSYVTGAIIKKFREKENMTQSQLADKLMVSNKTISSGKMARGYQTFLFWTHLQKR